MVDRLMRRSWWYLAGAVVTVLLLNGFGRAAPALPLASWVVRHTVLEAAAVLVAFAIFAVGCAPSSEVRDPALCALSTAFLGVALIDGMHLLTYQGMPAIHGQNDFHRNLIFWLSARLLSAAALLRYVARPSGGGGRGSTLARGLAWSLGLTAAVIWLALYRPGLVPPLYVEPTGITHLKIGIEAVVITGNVVTLWLLAARERAPASASVELLVLAVGLMTLSELCFTAFSVAGELNNVLGHVVKTVAYLVLAQAVVVASVRRPYGALLTSERELARSRALLERAFDASATGKVVVAASGEFVMANEAFAHLVGLTRESVPGKRWGDVLADSGDLLPDAAFTPLGAEVRLACARGGERWGVVRSYRLREHDGSEQLALAEVQDITEQRRAEQELARGEEVRRQSQKMDAVGQLAAGIAHDFNNLLAAIMGTCELVITRMRGHPAVLEDLEHINSTARRGAALTRQLLAFTRNAPSSPEPLDLGAVVADFERILQSVVTRGPRLILDVTRGLDILMDRSQLEQVLLNLVVNARDASVAGQTVAVRTMRLDLERPAHGIAGTIPVGAWAGLEVSDQGSGIAPEVADRMFEPFFTTKAKGEGTGLGLATAFGIVQRHGGYISVDSELGKGSRFRIVFPLRTA